MRLDRACEDTYRVPTKDLMMYLALLNRAEIKKDWTDLHEFHLSEMSITYPFGLELKNQGHPNIRVVLGSVVFERDNDVNTYFNPAFYSNLYGVEVRLSGFRKDDFRNFKTSGPHGIKSWSHMNINPETKSLVRNAIEKRIWNKVILYRK